MNTSGIITTIAGTGFAGYSGDDSAATAAKLNTPVGVAVDTAGIVYISDCINDRIRKVNNSGIITTIAGGMTGYSGDNRHPLQNYILRKVLCLTEAAIYI